MIWVGVSGLSAAAAEQTAFDARAIRAQARSGDEIRREKFTLYYEKLLGQASPKYFGPAVKTGDASFRGSEQNA